MWGKKIYLRQKLTIFPKLSNSTQLIIFKLSNATGLAGGLHFLYDKKSPCFKGIPLNKGFLIAGVVGIEPTSGVLETLILPMNYTPICNFAQGYLYHNCVEMSNKY